MAALVFVVTLFIHMVVIATNNGWHCIEQCIKSVLTNNIGEHVVVVDTGSEERYRTYLQELCKSIGCDLLMCSVPRYDYGAYVLAMDTFSTEKYFLLQHDSVIHKKNGVVSAMLNIASADKVCAWTTFAQFVCPFDDDNQRRWIVDGFGTDVYNVGIYGPNFLITSDSINKVRLRWNLADIVIDTKKKQQAMERAWPIIFADSGIAVTALEETDPTNFNYKFHTDKFDYFRKICHHTRQ